MSDSNKNLNEVTTMGDNHSPAPPANGLITDELLTAAIASEAVVAEAPVTTMGDNHSPAPPKLLSDGGATTQGDNHSPAPSPR